MREWILADNVRNWKGKENDYEPACVCITTKISPARRINCKTCISRNAMFTFYILVQPSYAREENQQLDNLLMSLACGCWYGNCLRHCLLQCRGNETNSISHESIDTSFSLNLWDLRCFKSHANKSVNVGAHFCIFRNIIQQAIRPAAES